MSHSNAIIWNDGLFYMNHFINPFEEKSLTHADFIDKQSKVLSFFKFAELHSDFYASKSFKHDNCCEKGFFPI